MVERTRAVLVVLLLATVTMAADRPLVRTLAEFSNGSEPEIFASIEPVPGGGAVLAGFTSSFTDAQMNAYVARIDAAGDLIWESTAGDTLSEEFYHALPTEDGGAIAVGTSNSFGDRVFDFYVVQFDGNGDQLWQKSLGGIPFDVATNIYPHPDGGWYLAGFRSNPDNNKADFRVARVDNTAEDVLWNNTYGGAEHDFLLAATPDGYGGLIVAGSTHSFNAANRDAYVLRINQQGTVLWQNKIGGPWPDVFNDVIRTSDGNFVLVGTTHRNPDSEESDIFVVKIAPDGTELGQLVLGGDSWDEAWAVTELGNRGLFIVGNSFDPLSGVMNGYGVRLDEYNNILWSMTYGDNDGYQEFHDVIQWTDQTVMAVGFTSSTDEGDADFLMQEINVAEQTVSPNPGLPDKAFMVESINPNPFNIRTTVYVTLPNAGELDLRVYNLLGRQVANIARGRFSEGPHRFTWAAVNQASGTYVVEARHNGHTARRKVMLLK